MPAGAGKPDSKAESKPVAKSAPAGPPARFADVWQIPAFVAAAGVLAGAVWYASSRRPKPDFDSMLSTAESTIEKQQYQDALTQLNTFVLPYYDHAAFTPDHRRDFHTLVARTIYLWQQAAPVKHAENYRTVVSEYTEAEGEHGTLNPPDNGYIVDALTQLEQLDAAAERLRELRGGSAPQRQALVRGVIEHALAGGRTTQPLALELLGALLADQDIPRDLRVWATARQAETLLAAGGTDDAITRLLKVLPRLSAAGDEGLGELYLMLGQAYLQADAVDEAARQLERAAALLDEHSPEMGRTQLMLARVSELARNSEDARERYEWVRDRMLGTPEAARATFGLAEVLATEGETDHALTLFAELIDEVKSGHAGREVTAESVSEALLRLHDEHANGGDPATAMRFVTLAETLFGADDAPTSILRAVATTTLKLAEDAAPRSRDEAGSEGVADPAARSNYLTAAQYFGQLARRVVLNAGSDHADALWSSAMCFDKGGDRDSAVAALQEFRDGYPDDTRRPEADFRLARIFQAAGQFGDAASMFAELIESPEAGKFNDDSYVPLAQTYLLDNDDTNDSRAVELLTTVVNGKLGGPTTDNYRDAITVLGEYLYDRGRAANARASGSGPDPAEVLAQAIARLEEAERRFPRQPRAHAVRFKLADACRLSAAAIDRKLAEAMPDAGRRELEATRRERLTRAMTLFETVKRQLESDADREPTTTRELFLRNAYFYAADCAFELGDYATAIRRYDEARERYTAEPAALVAMVQIVNAYLKMDDTRRAAAANEHARRFYASLPEAAWNDPNLPMTRRDWERWLDATDELNKLRSAAADEPESATPK